MLEYNVTGSCNKDPGYRSVVSLVDSVMRILCRLISTPYMYIQNMSNPRPLIRTRVGFRALHMGTALVLFNNTNDTWLVHWFVDELRILRSLCEQIHSYVESRIFEKFNPHNVVNDKTFYNLKEGIQL